MSPKKTVRKLELNRETLRELTADQARKVVGGSRTNGNFCTMTCTTGCWTR